jgi:integral membrane sensor domain MASE1
VDPRRARSWLWLLVLFLLTGVATELAVRLSRFGGGVSSIWVANGLLTGALLLSPRETWWRWMTAAAMGQIVGRIASGDAWLLTLGLVLANLLECTIIAFWVRRGDEELRQARSLGKVSRDALLSTVAACALSATAALPFLLLRVTTSLVETWLIWFSAHVVGMVIIATLAVCAFQPHVHLLGEKGRRLDYFSCLGLLLLVCWGVFSQESYPLLFLPFLPLLLQAFRHGLSGMLAGVVAWPSSAASPPPRTRVHSRCYPRARRSIASCSGRSTWPARAFSPSPPRWR